MNSTIFAAVEKHIDISLPLQLKTLSIGANAIQLYVPDAGAVKKQYQQQKESGRDIPFPYWSKVWPAALAMGFFLQQHSEYISGKKVLELAAGLGLPSLIAASYAHEVYCSDYITEAVAIAKKSAAYNNLSHMHCTVLDWHQLPASLTTDVLLLSDINYEPEAFDTLYKIITKFLANGATIILTTPQRLLAKPFIAQLLSWSIYQQQIAVPYEASTVMISLLVLRAA